MNSGARSLALVALLCLFGCGKGYDRDYQTNEAGAPSGTTAPKAAPPTTVTDTAGSTPAGEGGDAPAPAPIQRQIIRSGEVRLRVQSLDSAERRLAQIVAANGGYTANSSRTREIGNTLSGTTELRFPSSKFDQVLSNVRALGEVLGESITSADVTQEYIDLNARLKTQQELEARLLKLLNERTGKLTDIIEIEEKLAAVRNEIEGVQGRLRYLQNQVSLSTLSVTMVEPGAAGTSDTETFGGKIEEAFEQGIDALIDTLGAFIIVVLALLPLIAIAIILYYFLLRPWLRRRKERRAAKDPNPTPKG